MYTKKQIAEKFGKNGAFLTTNTVRETLKACGLSTTAQTYTDEEVQRFAIARRMIDEEKKTYTEVAAHFMPNARAANANAKAESTTGTGTGTENFTANQAQEATGGMDEMAFKTADKIATPYAQKIAELVPALTMYRLNEMMGNGSMEAGFEKVWQTIDANLGNSQALLEQGIQREQLHLPPSAQDLTPSPTELTESSES